jgi:hypothetical protein
MAKYTVTFSCGHTEVIELVGKVSERERKIAYFEQSGICSECYKAQQAVIKVAKLDAYKAANLPDLVGSPKQIAWGDKIRAAAYAEYKNKGFNYVATESSAAWWIDNRNDIDSVIRKRAYDAKELEMAKRVLTMTKSEIFKKAHEMAKKTTVKYPDTSYKTNFSLILKAVYAEIKALKAAA